MIIFSSSAINTCGLSSSAAGQTNTVLSTKLHLTFLPHFLQSFSPSCADVPLRNYKLTHSVVKHNQIFVKPHSRELNNTPLVCSNQPISQASVPATSSSRMRVMNHNWSATKQRLHPQSVAEINCHSVLSGDRIRQCETSSGSCHKDTDQCL